MAIASAALHPLAVTGIGSMPHLTVADALPSILGSQRPPAWPQLPRLGGGAHCIAEALAGLPGVQVSPEGAVTLPAGFGTALVRSAMPVAPLAIAALRAAVGPQAPLKGQIAGPITLALNTLLADGRCAADDAAACEALAEFLADAVAQQQAALQGGPLFLDEPDLPRGLQDQRLGPERCRTLLAQVLNAAMGPVGVHTCDEPDIAFLTSLPADIISVDVYRYGDMVTGQPVQEFLQRGGWMAWGIVPSEAEPLGSATAESLTLRLQAIWERLEREGVSPARLASQALVTPSCGLGLLSVAEAELALRLASDVAALLSDHGSVSEPTGGARS